LSQQWFWNNFCHNGTKFPNLGNGTQEEINDKKGIFKLQSMVAKNKDCVGKNACLKRVG